MKKYIILYWLLNMTIIIKAQERYKDLKFITGKWLVISAYDKYKNGINEFQNTQNDSVYIFQFKIKRNNKNFVYYKKVYNKQNGNIKIRFNIKLNANFNKDSSLFINERQWFFGMYRDVSISKGNYSDKYFKNIIYNVFNYDLVYTINNNILTIHNKTFDRGLKLKKM